MPHACTAGWAEVVSPRQMKSRRADSPPKGTAGITFLAEGAAHDHDISGRVAAQLRHAGVRLAVVIAAGAALTTTAAMSAAATTTAARIAADEQRHSPNTSRIASVRARVGERARSREPADVDNVRFLLFTSFHYVFCMFSWGETCNFSLENAIPKIFLRLRRAS